MRTFILSLFIICLAAVTALNVPMHHGIPESLPFGPKEEVVHGWNCDIRPWVRAPDLSPNLLSTADARLIADGADCVDLVKWEVGLRYNERSLVKLKCVVSLTYR